MLSLSNEIELSCYIINKLSTLISYDDFWSSKAAYVTYILRIDIECTLFRHSSLISFIILPMNLASLTAVCLEELLPILRNNQSV